MSCDFSGKLYEIFPKFSAVRKSASNLNLNLRVSLSSILYAGSGCFSGNNKKLTCFSKIFRPLNLH